MAYSINVLLALTTLWSRSVVVSGHLYSKDGGNVQEDKAIRVQITQDKDGNTIERFECPECKTWSPATKSLKIRVVIFDCAQCEFVINQSMDEFNDEEVH